MPVSLIQATAEEAADNFGPAHHPLLSPFSVHSGLFRSAFRSAVAGFLFPFVLVFPREARAGCLLRDLPAWPRTLNLIRSQLTKPDLIRVQPQGAVAAVPPSLSCPHLRKGGEHRTCKTNVLLASDTTCHRLETTKRAATIFPTHLSDQSFEPARRGDRPPSEI